MKYGYQWEKLMAAVDALVTSEKPLQKRLYYAAMAFHTLKESDFDEGEVRDLYKSIYQRLTSIRDEVRGSFEATTSQLSDDEARQLAADFFSLFLDIAEVYYGGAVKRN